MYSQRNASGGEQSDVHFCTSAHIATLQNCRRRKQPVALNASKASLLLMTNWPMRWWICWWALGHLGRRLVAWPGFGGCLQPRAPTPPHHHTASQSPTPRPPSWTKSPKWRASILARSPTGKEETKERKFLYGRQPDRDLKFHIKLQDAERTRRVRNFKFESFDTFL